MKINKTVRDLAERLLYDLTRLPGETSDDEKLLGRGLVRFLSTSHLSADALFDDRSSASTPKGTTKVGEVERG